MAIFKWSITFFKKKDYSSTRSCKSLTCCAEILKKWSAFLQISYKELRIMHDPVIRVCHTMSKCHTTLTRLQEKLSRFDVKLKKIDVKLKILRHCGIVHDTSSSVHDAKLIRIHQKLKILHVKLKILHQQLQKIDESLIRIDEVFAFNLIKTWFFVEKGHIGGEN